MSVSVAPSFDAAARIVQALPTLALVVIDACDCPAEATSLLARIRDCNRRLPVLWVGPAPLRGVERPDACVPEQTRPLELIECALDLLVDELYPPALVRSFVSACNVALTTTFEVAVDCEQPRLSRAAVRPGDVMNFWWTTRRPHDAEAERVLAELTAGDGLF